MKDWNARWHSVKQTGRLQEYQTHHTRRVQESRRQSETIERNDRTNTYKPEANGFQTVGFGFPDKTRSWWCAKKRGTHFTSSIREDSSNSYPITIIQHRLRKARPDSKSQILIHSIRNAHLKAPALSLNLAKPPLHAKRASTATPSAYTPGFPHISLERITGYRGPCRI